MKTFESPGAVPAPGASLTDQLGRQVTPETKRQKQLPQAAIRRRAADRVIRIEHVITDDLPDGRPTLSVGGSEIFWARVARLFDARTPWRRIHFQPNTALPIGVADETVNCSRRHTPKGNESETH